MDEKGLIDVLMEPADNILDLKLTFRFQPYGNGIMGMNGSIGEILPIFKNWHHLRWLTLLGERWVDAACPAKNLVCDFIWDMTSLIYCISDCLYRRKKILQREVYDWVQQHRHGFNCLVRSSKNPFKD